MCERVRCGDPSNSSRWDKWILALIVVLACALTAPGFVAPTSTSAPWVIDNVLNHLRYATLTSVVFYYPTLQANFLAAAVLVYLGTGYVAGVWSLAEIWAKLIDPFSFMGVAQILSLLFGIGAIVTTYYLGRRMFDRRAGLWAAAILAFTPTFNRYCHEGVPDAAMTFFAALATLCIVACLQNPSRRNYILAGASLGLATAAKYNAAVLIVVALCVHLWLWKRRGLPLKKVLDTNLFWAALASALAFCVTSFQVIRQPSSFLGYTLIYETDYKLLAYSGAVDPNRFIPWITHLVVAFRAEYGIALLFLIGLLYVGLRRSPASSFLALAALLALAYMGRWHMALMRFYLFIYPALAALAGGAVVGTRDWLRSRASPRLRIAALVPTVSALALIVWAVAAYLPQVRALMLPDTRKISQVWIEQHIPSGSVIAGPATPEGYPALLSREKVQSFLEYNRAPKSIRSEVASLLWKAPSYDLRSLYFKDTDPHFPSHWPEHIVKRYDESIYARRAVSKDASLGRLRDEGVQYLVTSSYDSDFYLKHTRVTDLPPYDPNSVRFDSIRRFFLELEEIPVGGGKNGIRCLVAFGRLPGITGPGIRIYQFGD